MFSKKRIPAPHVGCRDLFSYGAGKRCLLSAAFDKSKKEIPDLKSGILFVQSDRSGDLTGTHTPGTNIHMAGGTIDDCLHTLHVGLPGTIGTTMRVRNANTKGNALIAKLALSHPLHLLAVAYFHAFRQAQLI